MSQVLHPLVSHKKESLDWSDGDFYYPGLTRVRSIGGSSSFLHAALLAFFIPYRTNKLNGQMVLRKDMISSLRKRLANRLTELADPSQSNTIRIYDCLYKGKCAELASAIKSYTLEVMTSELLDEDFFLDDKYLELLSNEINKDIYILDSRTRDVYVKTEDVDIFYKNRGTIVLLALPNHFEVIGIENPDDPNDIRTYFDADSPLVRIIKNRYMHLKEMGYQS